MCSTSPKKKIVIKLVRNRSKEEDEILKEKAKKFDLIMEKLIIKLFTKTNI